VVTSPTAPDDAVVARVAAVLGAFDLQRPVLGLSDLARRAGLPKPTVHRLATQLVASGLLERDGERAAYRLGVRLFELGQQVPRPRVLRDAALPFLEDLHVATRETVHLATPSGRHVMYIEKLAGRPPGRTPSQVAGRLPLHCTATGKALLAHLPRSEVDRYLADPLERVTPHTIVVPAVLRAELAEVRRTGWAIEREETVVGYASVAAPVFDRDARPLAALSVTGPSRRFEPGHLGSTVRTAARGLTRALLGAPAEPGGHR
jgi:DNA-binding IclR family transcriptional regulator